MRALAAAVLAAVILILGGCADQRAVRLTFPEVRPCPVPTPPELQQAIGVEIARLRWRAPLLIGQFERLNTEAEFCRR